MPRLPIRFALVFILTLPPAGLLAQLSPSGSEFQINTYTTGRQGNPDVAIDSSGNWVVVYESAGDEVDTSNSSVQLRAGSGGMTTGVETLVNSAYTSGNQLDPRLAMNDDGSFVVVWSSFGSVGGDTSAFSIQGLRYDSAGSPTGGQFQVNSVTGGYQTVPDVAAAGDGRFVAVWEGEGVGGDSDGIVGRLFDSAGNAVASDFLVNTYTTSTQDEAAVGMAADGSFVVVWSSLGCSAPCADSSVVLAQRFGSTGTKVGSEIQVNDFTSLIQDLPDIAVNDDGSFVVAWQSFGTFGTETDPNDRFVAARRFDSAGNALAGQFQVNTYTTHNQDAPAIAVTPTGSFVVVYESREYNASDPFGALLAQGFDSSGSPVGGEFQVNTTTNLYQDLGSLALTGTGDLIITWRSNGSGGDDSLQESVQGQAYSGPVPVELESFSVE